MISLKKLLTYIPTIIHSTCDLAQAEHKQMSTTVVFLRNSWVFCYNLYAEPYRDRNLNKYFVLSMLPFLTLFKAKITYQLYAIKVFQATHLKNLHVSN